MSTETLLIVIFGAILMIISNLFIFYKSHPESFKFAIKVITLTFGSLFIFSFLIVLTGDKYVIFLSLFLFLALFFVLYIHFLKKHSNKPSVKAKYVLKSEHSFKNSNIEINQIFINLQRWIEQKGHSAKLFEDNGEYILKVTKGSALWKGILTFRIRGNKKQFSVYVEKGDKNWALIKGGFFGAYIQEKVNQLSYNSIDFISKCSGAIRIAVGEGI